MNIKRTKLDLCVLHLKLKVELVKYGGLSKSRNWRQLRTLSIVGKVMLPLSFKPRRKGPSLVPLHSVTKRLYSSKLQWRGKQSI